MKKIKKKYYTAMKDAMFKGIFGNEKNRDLLSWFISKCLNKKVIAVTLLNVELPKNNIYVKGKTLDMLVETEEGPINLELNSSYYDGLHRRNSAYIFEKYSEITKVKDNYNKMGKVIQINFTSGLPKNYPLKGEYKLIDKESAIEFIDNLTICEYNIDKIKEECYNKGEKGLEFIAMLDSDKKELEKLARGGDKMIEKFKKEVDRLNYDEIFGEFLSDEEDTKKLINTLKYNAQQEGLEEGLEKGLEKGIKQGIEKGIKEGIEQTAKKMVLENIDIKVISSITGLSTEEIENLK